MVRGHPRMSHAFGRRMLCAMPSDRPDHPEEDGAPVRARVKRRRDLRDHLFAYFLVNGVIWALWTVAGTGDLWPLWITGIWTVGIVFNVWDVYVGSRPITDADVRHETERLQRRQRGRHEDAGHRPA